MFKVLTFKMTVDNIRGLIKILANTKAKANTKDLFCGVSLRPLQSQYYRFFY